MKSATHRGNCQVCGHQHNVMENGLALHGYTVDFGFFAGTCSGSRHNPVQTERTITDSTIVALHQHALDSEATAVAYEGGYIKPARIQTGSKYNGHTGKRESVFIEFAEGTLGEQAKAVEIEAAQERQNARHARSHASMLQKMADKLYGTALVPIVEQVKAETPVVTVDVKAAKVTGTFATKAARKVELDKISRMFEKEAQKLHSMYLALPAGQRTEEGKEVYYGPMYPHEWRAKHSAMALKVFPQAAAIVAEIESLVAARNAVKAAP